MLRDKWEFEFAASKLCDAAKAKMNHHSERLKFWEDAKAKVMAEVKESGIEVSESQAGSSYSNANRIPEVMVRNDLQKGLTECHQKIQEHNKMVREYEGWVRVFLANPDLRHKLHADDYLYFFGV